MAKYVSCKVEGGQSTTPNNVLINMYNKHIIKKYYHHAMDKTTIYSRYQSIPCFTLKVHKRENCLAPILNFLLFT
jgi:hypothetical protein